MATPRNETEDLAAQIEAIRGEMQNMSATMGRIAEKGVHRAQDKAIETKESAEEVIKENPIQAIAIAAGLGLLIGIVAWVWKGNMWLGLVIGAALALNTVLAVSIGGVVPLLLKRFGQDPAVASGPLLTTITDMAGFFLVLSLASAFMPLLV